LLRTTENKSTSMMRCHSSTGRCSGLPGEHADVVHHHVHTAKLVKGTCFQLLKVAVCADVAPDSDGLPAGLDDLAGNREGVVAGDVGHDDLCSPLGQGLRGGTPDPALATGDNGDFAV
jgi:hypothetical protein